jgi:hypothetical protein
MPFIDKYLKHRFGFNIHPVEDYKEVTMGSGSATKVVSNNPDRLYLQIVNMGSNDVTLYPTEDVTAGNGVIISAGGGSVTLVIDEDMSLVMLPWYGICASGTPTLLVFEVESG